MAEMPSYEELQERVQELEAAEVNQSKQSNALKKLFDLSLDMLCVANFDGYFQVINPAFESTLGYSRQELLKYPFTEFVHAGDMPATQAAVEQLAAGKSVTYFENRYRCKDGSYKWLAWTSVPVTDERCMYAVARDITGRKQVQTALQKSEARLQTLFNSAAEFIYLISPEGKVLHANRRVMQHSGYRESEILGKNIKDFLTEESQHTFDCNLRSLQERGYDRADIEFVCKDGHMIQMECSATAVPDENGEFTSFLVIQRDMTERTRAATALAESERRFRTVFNSSCQLIGLLDSDGILLEANQTALDFGGLRQEDVVGRPFWETVWWCYSDKVKQRLKNAVRQASRGEPVGYEEEVLGRDNTIRLIEFTLRPVTDEQGRTVLIIPEGRDITESRQAEEEVQRCQREMAHIMRLGTMGEMASGMAHELNQPLTALVSYCGTAISLVNSLSSPPQQLNELIERATEQAHRASDIIRNLREFVSKGDNHKELLELDRVIRGIIILLKYEVQEAGVKIEYYPDCQTCKVMVDKIQIDQVLTNMVRNSVEAIRHAKITKGQIALHTHLLPNDKVEVTVADNGPGIDADMAGKIFAPFQTSKETGMGIGLSLSRRIVEAHGGKLWVEEDYKNGALFGFELPVSK